MSGSIFRVIYSDKNTDFYQKICQGPRLNEFVISADLFCIHHTFIFARSRAQKRASTVVSTPGVDARKSIN